MQHEGRHLVEQLRVVDGDKHGGAVRRLGDRGEAGRDDVDRVGVDLVDPLRERTQRHALGGRRSRHRAHQPSALFRHGDGLTGQPGLPHSGLSGDDDAGPVDTVGRVAEGIGDEAHLLDSTYQWPVPHGG